jgi:hypothetical protein
MKTQKTKDLWNPQIVEPGQPAAESALSTMNLVSGFQRYETDGE